MSPSGRLIRRWTASGKAVPHCGSRVNSRAMWRRWWSPSGPRFGRQEQVWILVTWADGRREPIYEDYEPWSSVAELKMGHLLVSTTQGDIDFEVRWLEGKAREAAWARFGILDKVEAYMGETNVDG